jgi:hypothetical protein
MRNILCTLLFSIMSLGVSAQSFDFTGEIGYDSDYVWRGVSQGNQPAFSIGGTVVHNTTGLYGGIILPVSDTINLNVGYIRYTYDGTVASFEELYVIADIGDLSLSYYQDIDTNDNYAEVGYNLWFIPVLDVTLVGGLYDSEETFGQLDVSYSFNDSWSLNGIIGQDVFEDQVADSFSVGILYTY